MAKIRVLDEQLSNQIAAGEVVERPSSVIKELVENAIDAGASTVDVTVEEGGLTLVRVADNGSGIEPEDIATAFHRHATSKISSDKDLFRISSLGFRGEALPSIAAVSRVECVSSPDATGLGRRLVIEGGTITANEEHNAPQGTDIAVRELFYNTPARLKYMKTIQTEIGHIADYVNRLALAHPGIAFTLKHNGGLLLRTLGSGDRLQTFAAIYGTATAKAMLPIGGEHPDYDVQGYISKPEQTRANRGGITVIVNGRYIRSFVINQAILQAYHTLLPINRFPLAVLELGMHPSLVDVNVHPSKMEVRFSKEAELRQFIEETIAQTLGKIRHIPGPSSGERSKPAFVQERISFYQAEAGLPEPPGAAPFGSGPVVGGAGHAARASDGSAARPDNDGGRSGHAASPYGYGDSRSGRGEGRAGYADSGTGPYGRGGSARSAADVQGGRTVVPNDATERLYAPPASAGADSVRETAAGTEYAWPDASPMRGEGGWPSASQPIAGGDAGERPEGGPTDFAGGLAPAEGANSGGSDKDGESFPELYWIGQLHGTYIVAQNEEGLYLIDQHAAHERINYEYYFDKFGRPEQASQQLLVPLTLEFTPTEAAALRGKLDRMAAAGVELEPFGQHAFLVRSYPEWLPKGDEQAVIEEMAEWLLSEKGNVDIGKLREKSAIMCSCKASIKANDRLTREEGEGLLHRLAACRQPYTCPHGRPIVVHMSTYQLEKMFKRVMS